MATAVISPDHDTIVAEIFIAAPPARVFQAITSHGEGWKRVLGWLTNSWRRAQHRNLNERAC